MKGFNPRTRMGCDLITLPLYIVGNVSIHAPAWGATGQQTKQIEAAYSFNPRTRMGCDTTTTGRFPRT